MGKYAAIVQDVGKAYVGVFPREVDVDSAVVLAFAFRFPAAPLPRPQSLWSEGLLAISLRCPVRSWLLRLKGQRVVGWLAGAETKISMWAPVSLWNSNRACITLVLLKPSTGLRVKWLQMLRNHIFPNFALLINQQFGRIPLFQWKFGDALIGRDRSCSPLSEMFCGCIINLNGHYQFYFSAKILIFVLIYAAKQH